jgi:hypothetical protein
VKNGVVAGLDSGALQREQTGLSGIDGDSERSAPANQMGRWQPIPTSEIHKVAAL